MLRHFSLDEDKIRTVLERFKGTIKQTPPMYSAIKVSGMPLYKLARKGIEIERPYKFINIYEIKLAGFIPPFLEIRVSCSKGTYIRTLCDNIGTALGMGAHVTDLKRTKTGDFGIEDSADISELPGKEISLCSIDTALKRFKDVVLAQRDFLRVIKGMMIIRDDLLELPLNSYLRLKSPDGKMFAIGKATETGIKIERLLNIHDA
ncbi:MAG: hypothetical protein HY754_15045 [Nitrospirae bacterium]|nr:hypothetical protein [Nitrospirota bacterium]